MEGDARTADFHPGCLWRTVPGRWYLNNRMNIWIANRGGK